MIRHVAEGDPFRCAGDLFKMLLPMDEGECCEVVLETVGPGHSTPPNQYATFVQIYVVLRGEAKVTIGRETRTVRAPAVAFIPKDTNHFVSNESSANVEYCKYCEILIPQEPFPFVSETRPASTARATFM